jgi:hypothetical protein
MTDSENNKLLVQKAASIWESRDFLLIEGNI